MNFATFNFNNSNVHTVLDETGVIWFVASDIASILGYQNTQDMTRNLYDDKKSKIILRTLSGYQETTIINESGLCSVIINVCKPESRALLNWVTSEVIPVIRKKDRYVTSSRTSKTLFNEEATGLEALYHILSMSELCKFNQFRGIVEEHHVYTDSIPTCAADTPTVCSSEQIPSITSIIDCI